MSCVCSKKNITGFWQILAKKIAKKGSVCCYEKYKIKLNLEELKQFCCIYDNEILFYHLYEIKKPIFSLESNNYDSHYIKLCCKYDSPKIFKKLLSIIKKWNILEVFDDLLDNNALNCFDIIVIFLLFSDHIDFVEFRSKYYKFSKYLDFYEQMRLFNILRFKELQKEDLGGVIVDVSDLLIIAVKKKRWASIEIMWHLITEKNKEYLLKNAIEQNITELIEKCLN